VLDLDVLIIVEDDDDETPRKQSKLSTPTGPSPEQVSLAKYTIVSLEENIFNTRMFLKGMEKHMSEAEGHVAKSENSLLVVQSCIVDVASCPMLSIHVHVHSPCVTPK
jgi:hypothetical protein